jgi:hypothetical protein
MSPVAAMMHRILWVEMNMAEDHFPSTVHESWGELMNPEPVTVTVVPPS